MPQAIPALINIAIAAEYYYAAVVLLVIAPIKGERCRPRRGARKVVRNEPA